MLKIDIIERDNVNCVLQSKNMFVYKSRDNARLKRILLCQARYLNIFPKDFTNSSGRVSDNSYLCRRIIEWSKRSSDLNPSDFFLWGHFKSVVCRTQPNDTEELTRRNTACCSIAGEVFQDEFESRLYYCFFIIHYPTN